MNIAIIYGTETGNSEGLANDAKDYFAGQGKEAEVFDMDEVSVEKLAEYPNLLVITSTWGDGEPPSNAEALYESLQQSDADLSSVHYAVYALGMDSFEHFCKAGKDFDLFLEQRGAKRLHPVALSNEDYDTTFPAWLDEIAPKLV